MARHSHEEKLKKFRTAVTEDDWYGMIRAQVKLALKGDTPAFKVLVEHALGKAQEVIKMEITESRKPMSLDEIDRELSDLRIETEGVITSKRTKKSISEK